MLSGITDDRNHNHAHEYLGDAERSPRTLDCSNEKLREHRNDRSRYGQDGDGFSARPMFALFLQRILRADKEVLMGLERKSEHADVSKKEHDGDAQ